MRLREGFFAESVVTGAAAAGAPKRPPAGAAAAGAPKRPVAGVAVRVSAGAGGAVVAPNRLPPGAGALPKRPPAGAATPGLSLSAPDRKETRNAVQRKRPGALPPRGSA